MPIARRIINSYVAPPGPYGPPPMGDPRMMQPNGYNAGYVDPAYGYPPAYGSPYVDDYPIGIRGRRAGRRLHDGYYDRGVGGPITGPLLGTRRAGPVGMLIGGMTDMLVNRQDNKHEREMIQQQQQQQQMSRSVGEPSYMDDQRLGTRQMQQQQTRSLTPDGRGIRLDAPRSRERAASRGRQPTSDDEDEDYEYHERYDPAVAREYEKHHQNVESRGRRQQQEWQPGPPPYQTAANERSAGPARRE